MNYREKYPWLYDVLFLLVLLLAGYLRLTGVDWGQGGGQHPDENHFSSVLGALRSQKCADPSLPVEACPAEQKRWLSLGDYFNTKTSPLNPYTHNLGYVYGDLPMTIVRIAADATGQTNLRLFGRQFSAFADLLAIFFLYLIVSRLYGRRVGLLASLFSALAVMQIQQAHFFTVDLFVNTFEFLALWFAVAILEHREKKVESKVEWREEMEEGLENGEEKIENRELLEVVGSSTETPEVALTNSQDRSSSIADYLKHVSRKPLFLYSIGFGFALGMAMASKINIAPLAIVLPAAFVLRYFILKREEVDFPTEPRHLTTDYWTLVIVCLIAGGLATIISFRIFQPYAFDGLGLNSRWVADIQQQRAQATGEDDRPWNLQWARRSHLYSFTNLTVWGLGLPLGILAWAGFLYMGWRIFKGEWRHALLWGWTAVYFLWQSLQFNPTMRYQLPIYPLLAMMAAWFLFEVSGAEVSRARKYAVGTVGVIVLVLTAVWAFTFHTIYLRDEPRIAASRWVFQNVHGPINLQIQTEDSTYNQPLPFPAGVNIQSGSPYQTAFTAQNDGLLTSILLAHVNAVPDQIPVQLYLSIWNRPDDPQPLASAFATTPGPTPTDDTSLTVNLDQTLTLTANQTYQLKIEMTTPQGRVNLCGSIRYLIQALDQVIEQSTDVSSACIITAEMPYVISFVPQADGSLNQIVLGRVISVAENASATPHTLSLFVSREPGVTDERALASASLTETFAGSEDPRGDTYTLTLDRPVSLEPGTQYYLWLGTDSGILSLSGATVANETDYDYPLPINVDGHNAFGGLYRGDLNLQVYWSDDAAKLDRFIRTLDETDYILLPTNHQYGQITRVPERYPLTTLYYRELIGCPEDTDIFWCYRVAQPGMFDGRLGYDLVAVFESYPTLGPLVINDQAAEEAFTFYDHPKVMIFKKNESFDIAKVKSVLGSVDLTKVVQLAPRQFDDYASLLLPADKLARQRAGGTWSDLFDYDWIQNRYPVVGLIVWYLFIFILGLAVYPLARLAMPGLADKGYPLSRALGLVLFGYLAWLGGSIGIPYSRPTIAIVFGLILVTGGLLAYYQRAELREEWREKRKYFLLIEGLFLAFFLLDLLIRIGNPDLWHPAKGGERPMDFSYFNAVIKSTVFPPYDPWFAGGYINYYYYGFVLVGTPVKLLGIVPSIAYNFILPTLFAMVAVCAFSLGWNLIRKDEGATPENSGTAFRLQLSALIGGFASLALTLLLGNLGTIQLVYQKLQELGAQGTFSWDKTIPILQRWTWAIQGFVLTLKGNSLPMGPGEWYWNPSRVVPPGGGGNEITEFPLFTFLYSDLHAHMIAIPLALLALSWGLAVVAGRARWRNPLSAALGLVVGGFIIGSFYPANLSDSYTYLLFGMIAIGYAVFRYTETTSLVRRIAFTLVAAVALYLLSNYLYVPYRTWYSQAYSALDPWKGPYTPIWSYLIHWLVFLFIVVSWMAWETREWMAATPMSALQKLKPYQLLIEGALVVFALTLLVLQFLIGTSVGWIALPIAAWAAVLLLRPDLTDAKRFVLFLIGTALLITIVVEVVVVSGDIGRQNTIFKFYMQAWLMLAVSAGAAFTWTLPAFFKWLPGWRIFWQTAMILLISGAALFTVTGTWGKIRDRWVLEAPHVLDSMTFMNYVHQHGEFGQTLDLSEDYRAIRWMQDHVEGSPVIVETNCPEYRWCTRFTMYTGLPSVVGWNWHQRQQRVFMSLSVEDRVLDIGNFYNTADVEAARTFLEEYDVSYIIVGQLERAAYTPEGIAKFEQFEGQYWQEVYRDGSTAIYEVLQ